jgi:mxaJ protein
MNAACKRRPSIPRIARLVAAACLLGSGAVHAEEGPDLFKVCAPPYTMPMSDLDGAGFENKIAELFASQLGQKTTFTWFPQRLGFIRATLKNNETDDGSYKCDFVMGVIENFELAATTRPYLRSSWAMVVRKGAGVDWLKSQSDLANLDDEKRQQLKLGIWDQGPTTDWVFKLGLIDNAVPIPMMAGDPKLSPADAVSRAFGADRVNVGFLWGPLAGWLAKKQPDVLVIPLQNEGDIKFDFQIAMAVRHGDDKRLKLLNGLIEKNQAKIDAILAEYGVPTLPLQLDKKRKDDDDD